jgi:pSer/pThr/pTyr-binding forkhead associated (FHA) protein
MWQFRRSRRTVPCRDADSSILVARCSSCGRVSDPQHSYCAYCGWRVRVDDQEVPVFGLPEGDQGSPATPTPPFLPLSSVSLPPNRRATPPGPAPALSIGAPRGGTRRVLRTAPCPHCHRNIDKSLVFCTHCGLKTGFVSNLTHYCTTCGTRVPDDEATFCTFCGEPIRGGLDAPRDAASTKPRGIAAVVPPNAVPRLAVLDDQGAVVREIPIEREEIIVGRTQGDVQFSDDDALSPEHALLTWRSNALCVRDLGSSNGSWVFITDPHVLSDGDLLLIGSQIIRFRRLATAFEDASVSPVQAGSRVPVRDVAMLEQLRSDGSVRDVIYLSPLRAVLIGRERGDWVFPYDPTMSASHAEVRCLPEGQGEGDECLVRDVGSRNGVAVLVRGERAVNPGERILLGRKVLRVELS